VSHTWARRTDSDRAYLNFVRSGDVYEATIVNSMQKVSDRRRSSREARLNTQEVFVRSTEAVLYSAS
jgi:hypothetical protein